MPPGGKNRDPHYMNLRNGNMLSLHGKAKNQVEEDNKNFNPATMGNRQFKNLSFRKAKGLAVSKRNNSGIRRAAAKKLQMGRMPSFTAKRGKFS